MLGVWLGHSDRLLQIRDTEREPPGPEKSNPQSMCCHLTR